MVDVTITIPNDKLPRVRTGILTIHPIPVDEEGTPLYTEMQWIKLLIRKYLIELVHQGERKIAFDNLQILKDETLVEN